MPTRCRCRSVRSSVPKNDRQRGFGRGTTPNETLRGVTLSLAGISESDTVVPVTSDPFDHLPLTPAQFHVLVALSNGPLHGYAIMQAVEEASDGLVQMGPATVYSTLQRLSDQGLAEECTGPPDPDDDKRRRYYQLTGLGRAVCVAEADRLATLAQTARTNLRPRLA